ncbi:ComEC/Rec2 family competence protein [Helicobacter himalayensis]|uniref:ComEC/Rec2 family competence protein n=1 Tax=Helicobacter himalayensis TaxID=1591088 RepID=UPI003D6E6D56
MSDSHKKAESNTSQPKKSPSYSFFKLFAKHLWQSYKDANKAINTTSTLSVRLLEKKFHWIFFILGCLCIFGAFLSLEYRNYARYMDSMQNPTTLNAQVLAQYTKLDKNNKPYFVLKLRTQDGAILYTTSKEDLKDITHSFVEVYGKSAECGFWQYLQSCFFITFSLSLESTKDFRTPLREFIKAQHTDSELSALYLTLYLADFLPKPLREVSNKLGIAHLIAISGFHLGVLSVCIAFVLNLCYKPLHHYFPYRNRFFDISTLTLLVLFGYLLLIYLSPSFLRAWAMSALALFFVYKGVRVVSFEFLFIVVIICVSFFPRLIFSVGFFLSCMGVFYIYLFLRYFRPLARSKLYNLTLTPLFFNTSIFLHMLIIVHFFFPYFSTHTLSAIPLSIAFVPFFPLSILAHCFSLGGIFDSLLAKLFSLEIFSIEVFAPEWLFGIYLILSALSVRFLSAYIGLFALSAGFFGFLVYSLCVA